jgi:hypothetical protein
MKKEHNIMAEKRRETVRLEVIDDPEGAEMNGAGTRIPGEGRSTRRIGILSFSSPGHYDPLTALGRRLQSRGHDVVYFQVADLERRSGRRACGSARSAGRTSHPARSACGMRSWVSSRAPPLCGARFAASD